MLMKLTLLPFPLFAVKYIAQAKSVRMTRRECPAKVIVEQYNYGMCYTHNDEFPLVASQKNWPGEEPVIYSYAVVRQ